MVKYLHEESTADCINANSHTYKYNVPTDWKLRENSSKWRTGADGARVEGSGRCEVDCDEEEVHYDGDIDISLKMLCGQADEKIASSEADTSPVLRYLFKGQMTS